MHLEFEKAAPLCGVAFCF